MMSSQVVSSAGLDRLMRSTSSPLLLGSEEQKNPSATDVVTTNVFNSVIHGPTKTHGSDIFDFDHSDSDCGDFPSPPDYTPISTRPASPILSNPLSSSPIPIIPGGEQTVVFTIGPSIDLKMSPQMNKRHLPSPVHRHRAPEADRSVATQPTPNRPAFQSNRHLPPKDVADDLCACNIL